MTLVLLKLFFDGHGRNNTIDELLRMRGTVIFKPKITNIQLSNLFLFGQTIDVSLKNSMMSCVNS